MTGLVLCLGIGLFGISGGILGCSSGEGGTSPIDDGGGGGEPVQPDEPDEPEVPTDVQHFFTIEPDTTFSIDGLFDLDFDDDANNKIDVGNTVVVQPDGKIVVAGYVNWSGAHDADLGIARLNTDGTLDTTFSTDGIAIMTDCDSFWGLQWWAQQGLALQSDGKILVGGDCQRYARTYRLNSDGSLDASFNAAGTPGYIDIDKGIGGGVGNGAWSSVFSLAVQPDGLGGEKIIVGGIANNTADWTVIPLWLLARLNADGTIDATFGDQGAHPGILIEDWGTTHNDGVRDMIILSDRRIIAYGNTSHLDPALNVDFATARYSADGVLDTTFGTNGMTAVDFGGMDWSYPIALGPDGTLVGGAHVNCCAPTSDTGLFRLTSEGALDTTFDTDGMLTLDLGLGAGDFGNAVGVLPDGRTIVGGYGNSDFMLAMLEIDGTLSGDFGTGGVLFTDFYGSSDGLNAFQIFDVVTDAYGNVESFRLVAIGSTVNPPDPDPHFAITMYHSVLVE